MRINRRNFLFGSAAVMTLAGCATSTAQVGKRILKPGEKRTIAMIGYGIQMRTALIPQFLQSDLAPNVRITHVCDCDRVRAAAGAKQVSEAYAKRGEKLPVCVPVADFRDILNDPSIDMVCIATPDHWHAYIAVEAMKHGKDVYCEKPVTFTIDEARKVIAAEKKYGRVFQAGSMQRSWREFRVAVSLVLNGVIGDLKYVDANYGRGGEKLGGPSHPIRFFDDPNNAATEGAPNPDVDWAMWLGPAKMRPYSDQLAPRGVNNFYPMFWRFDDDIGSGYNGDWGAHHLDIAQWGMGMDRSGPKKIICSEEPHSTNLYHGGRRQFGMKMIFDSPMGEIELYHGPFGVWGTVFYGTKGIVAVNRGKIAVWQGTGLVRPTAEVRAALQDAQNLYMKDKVVASSIGADYGTDAMVKADNGLADVLTQLEGRFKLKTARVQLQKSSNQVRNFVDCVETRELPISSAETSCRSGALCLLCNLSYQYDTSFDWDPKAMTFANGTGKGISLKREGDCNGWKVEV